MPANMTNSAFGSSTPPRICSGRIPMPVAASTDAAGTPSMPAYVLRTIGSSDAAHNPKIAGTTPMPSRLIASASTASVGIVLPIFSACMIVFGKRGASAAG